MGVNILDPKEWKLRAISVAQSRIDPMAASNVELEARLIELADLIDGTTCPFVYLRPAPPAMNAPRPSRRGSTGGAR